MLPGPVSHLKIAYMESDKYVIAMVARAKPSGEMYNPETEEKHLSSAMTHTGGYVVGMQLLKMKVLLTIDLAVLGRIQRIGRRRC